MKHFENITEEEINILKATVTKVGVLIAIADGKMDTDEQYWADKVTHIRSYGEPNELNEFYASIDENFHATCEAEVKALPADMKEAQTCLSDDIARVNDILPKLEPKIAYLLYKSYTSFAMHVAKASGGFMGFFSVGSEEAKVVELPMLNVVEAPPEVETTEEDAV